MARCRMSVGLAFSIAVAATAAAFVLRGLPLAVLTIPAVVASVARRSRATLYIYALVAATAPGIFMNAVYFSNEGQAVFTILGHEVRSGALEGFANVFLRTVLIAAVGSWFVSSYRPMEVVRGLEEAGLPKGLAFSIAYALRSAELVARDFSEVLDSRRQRGRKFVPLNPVHVAEVLLPVVRLSYERALWVGISMDLRGFRLRRIRARPRLLACEQNNN
ncbi:MAG: energy-coupling factor transporter transmembrane component T [Desulfurococcaceae archaeon]